MARKDFLKTAPAASDGGGKAACIYKKLHVHSRIEAVLKYMGRPATPSA